jgi:hypothetical protein
MGKEEDVMKKVILFCLISFIFLVNSAMAGPANIAGVWTGDGEAILPNGDICYVNPIEGTVFQKGTLIYGTFDFTVESGNCPGGSGISFTGNISAGNQIKAVLSVEDFGGIGVLDAKLMGKKISGVLVDFSDGSTTNFSVTPGD